MNLKIPAVLLFLMLSSITFGQITITEIMYAPPTATENEWFEIHNNTGSAINLQNWKWKDATSTIRTITTTLNYTLQPNSFAIICENAANFNTNYPSVIPPVIESSGWNALNNTGDNVILIDPSGIRIDSISYLPSWGGSTGGKSLERINLLINPNVSTNWGSSLIRSTPNATNSISPRNNDLILSTFKLTPTSVLVGDSINVKGVIKNAGANNATSFSYSIYLDVNHDNIPQPSEIINTSNYGSLNASDSIVNSYKYTTADTGTKQFIGKVVYPADEDTTSNIKFASATVGNVAPSALGMIINEIMYAPVSPEPEWIELYNRSASPLNLKNWKITDLTGPALTITTIDKIIQPGGYVVITSGNLAATHPGIDTSKIIVMSSFPSLNNSGDDMTLTNNSGQVSDFVPYTTSFGGSSGNFSAERRDPNGSSTLSTNWGSSTATEKSTPTRVNSLTPKQFDVALRTFVITPAFPVINDSLHLSLNLKNIGLSTAANVTLNIYKDVNRDSIPQVSELIKTFNYASLNVGDSVNALYVTLPDTGVGVKQYIGKVEFPGDLDITNNKLIRSVNVSSSGGIAGVIINEIMADPNTPEPEWVELYNNSDNDINLKNWKISDATASPVTIITTDNFILHRSYKVLAKNNSILLNHPLIDSTKIIYVASLPSLNNDGDDLTIFNSKSLIADNVHYYSRWGGGNGYSLERKTFNGGSNDSTNWGTSVDCEKSSPTRENSFKNAVSYSAMDLVINEIMSDPLTGNAEYVEIYNPRSFSIDLKGWRFNESSNYVHLTDSCNSMLESGGYIVIASDTTIFLRFPYLTDPAFKKRVVINTSLSLSNDGETLSLFDINNNLIDQLSYLANWKNPNLSDAKGYSLEKLNPLFASNNRSSWSSSAATLGGTPLKVNSIYTNNSQTGTNVSVSPNPFSPDNDGFEDFTVINYKLKSNISQIRAKVYDIKGRLVRDLANNQISGSNGTIIFDGLDNSKQKLRIGIYIVFIEAVDQNGGVVETAKTSVVVAAKL